MFSLFIFDNIYFPLNFTEVSNHVSSPMAAMVKIIITINKTEIIIIGFVLIIIITEGIIGIIIPCIEAIKGSRLTIIL